MGADGDNVIGRGDTVSRSTAQGRVEAAGSVALEGLPMAVLAMPLVLLKSA
jgi:hypothetical protein